VEKTPSKPDTKEKKSSEKPQRSKKERKFSFFIPVALAGLVLIFLFHYFWRSPAPEAPASAFSPSESFFTMLRKEIQEVGEAKSYFRWAQNIQGSETLPSGLSTSNAYPSDFLNAAQNYARAFERYSHAKQVMESIKKGDLVENDEACKKSFVQILEKYIAATEIFKENAKELYQRKEKGEEEKEDPIITDAHAKYELAEQLMSRFLLEGCQGQFFKYVKSKDAAQKKLAFLAYQNFFLENFDPQTTAMLFDYQSSEDSLGAILKMNL